MSGKWLRFWRDFLLIVVLIACGLFMGVVLLEYLAGCGALYTDSEGVRHMGECLWLPIGDK
jgi:hypothetical protein